MKRLLIVLLVGVCLVAAATVWAQEKKYGAGVSLQATTTVEELLAHPDQYLGKTVRVNGVITGVCDMAGCWMEMVDPNADPNTAKGLRFKVDDGVIVFPVTAKGKRASAEGVFEKVSAAMAKEYAADQAKATGGDTKNAVPGYQVKATGAIIY